MKTTNQREIKKRENEDEKRKQKNLRKGGTDHRERKFRLAFKIP